MMQTFKRHFAVVALLLSLFGCEEQPVSLQLPEVQKDQPTQIDEVDELEDFIVIQIVLKAEGAPVGDSGDPITVENVQRRAASPARRDRVKNALEAMGFSIVSEGPLNIGIEGPRDLIESTFKVRAQETGVDSQVEGKTYVLVGQAEIPPDIAEDIVDIAVPTPPELFQ